MKVIKADIAAREKAIQKARRITELRGVPEAKRTSAENDELKKLTQLVRFPEIEAELEKLRKDLKALEGELKKVQKDFKGKKRKTPEVEKRIEAELFKISKRIEAKKSEIDSKKAELDWRTTCANTMSDTLGGFLLMTVNIMLSSKAASKKLIAKQRGKGFESMKDLLKAGASFDLMDMPLAYKDMEVLDVLLSFGAEVNVKVAAQVVRDSDFAKDTMEQLDELLEKHGVGMKTRSSIFEASIGSKSKYTNPGGKVKPDVAAIKRTKEASAGFMLAVLGLESREDIEDTVLFDKDDPKIEFEIIKFVSPNMKIEFESGKKASVIDTIIQEAHIPALKFLRDNNFINKAEYDKVIKVFKVGEKVRGESGRTLSKKLFEGLEKSAPLDYLEELLLMTGRKGLQYKKGGKSVYDLMVEKGRGDLISIAASEGLIKPSEYKQVTDKLLKTKVSVKIAEEPIKLQDDLHTLRKKAWILNNCDFNSLDFKESLKKYCAWKDSLQSKGLDKHARKTIKDSLAYYVEDNPEKALTFAYVYKTFGNPFDEKGKWREGLDLTVIKREVNMKLDSIQAGMIKQFGADAPNTIEEYQPSFFERLWMLATVLPIKLSQLKTVTVLGVLSTVKEEFAATKSKKFTVEKSLHRSDLELEASLDQLQHILDTGETPPGLSTEPISQEEMDKVLMDLYEVDSPEELKKAMKANSGKTTDQLLQEIEEMTAEESTVKTPKTKVNPAELEVDLSSRDFSAMWRSFAGIGPDDIVVTPDNVKQVREMILRPKGDSEITR